MRSDTYIQHLYQNIFFYLLRVSVNSNQIEKKCFLRKGTSDSISASYHRFPFSIIETDPIFEIMQLDL